MPSIWGYELRGKRERERGTTKSEKTCFTAKGDNRCYIELLRCTLYSDVVQNSPAAYAQVKKVNRTLNIVHTM